MKVLTRSDERESGQFPVTRWTLVLESQGSDDDARKRALSHICEAYWYPIYCFVRRRGLSPADAEDSTQSFFCDLLEHNRFQNFSEDKGKLRAYLLTSIKRYLRNEWVASRAQKRGGGLAPLSLDAELAEKRYEVEPSEFASPVQLFELRWALTVLERALGRVKAHYEEQGKDEVFAEFRHHLSGDGDLSFREVGVKLGVGESTARVMLFRMRKLYRSCIEEEIGRTIVDGESVEEEIDYLNRIFAN